MDYGQDERSGKPPINQNGVFDGDLSPGKKSD
jgi:hypothetical protein